MSLTSRLIQVEAERELYRIVDLSRENRFIRDVIVWSATVARSSRRASQVRSITICDRYYDEHTRGISYGSILKLYDSLKDGFLATAGLKHLRIVALAPRKKSLPLLLRQTLLGVTFSLHSLIGVWISHHRVPTYLEFYEFVRQHSDLVEWDPWPAYGADIPTTSEDTLPYDFMPRLTTVTITSPWLLSHLSNYPRKITRISLTISGFSNWVEGLGKYRYLTHFKFIQSDVMKEELHLDYLAKVAKCQPELLMFHYDINGFEWRNVSRSSFTASIIFKERFYRLQAPNLWLH